MAEFFMGLTGVGLLVLLIGLIGKYREESREDDRRSELEGRQ